MIVLGADVATHAYWPPMELALRDPDRKAVGETAGQRVTEGQ